MKHLSFLLFLTILLFSCEQKNNRDKVINFSKILFTNTSLQIMAKQQAFIDESLEDLKKIKEDSEAKINTKHLRQLLDSARTVNDISFTGVSKLQEVDDQINLREKALNEINLFKSAYANEFERLIQILESNDKNKLEKAYNLLYGKLQDIKKVQDITEEAEQEMINKYDIPSDFNK